MLAFLLFTLLLGIAFVSVILAIVKSEPDWLAPWPQPVDRERPIMAVVILNGRWTPNEALANILGCKKSQCSWVWSGYSWGHQEMSKSEAFRAAREMARDL